MSLAWGGGGGGGGGGLLREYHMYTPPTPT